AQCRPDTVGSGKFQEVDGVPVVGELSWPVLGDREHTRRALQRTRLVGCQGCSEAVDADGILLERVGANPGGRILLLFLEVRPIALGTARRYVHPIALAGTCRTKALDVAVIRGDRLVREGDDVPVWDR